MIRRYHVEITAAALQDRVSPLALEAVLAANLAQDRLRGQIGHPEYHFDDNAFQGAAAYLAAQREIILQSLTRGGAPVQAWAAFGRLSHAVQDFYAHSNYLALWLLCQPGESPPAPDQVDFLDPQVMASPRLRSGRIYPLEALSAIPFLRPLVRRLLPRDAHAWMNLDSPDRGSLFPYALHAARKRTRYEFDQVSGQIRQNLGDIALARFTDLRT